MRVYIAGHKGLVGSSLIRTLPEGFELITSDRSNLDLRNKNATLGFLKTHTPDLVIVAAAKVGGIGANSKFQKEFLYENLEIQNSILMASAKCEIPNLVFLGSSCIYPKDAPQPIGENALLTGVLESTNEGYAIAKIAGIRLVKAIYDQDGLNYFSLMPTNLYGPNDNFDLNTSHVPAALMRRFFEAKRDNSKEVTVWGSGKPRREFMHAEDLARACWFFINKRVGGELINIGTGLDLEISKFAELIAGVVGFQGEIVYDTNRPDGTFQKLLNIEKAHSYGWHHKIDLQDGIRETYDWFCKTLNKEHIRGF